MKREFVAEIEKKVLVLEVFPKEKGYFDAVIYEPGQKYSSKVSGVYSDAVEAVKSCVGKMGRFMLRTEIVTTDKGAVFQAHTLKLVPVPAS